MCFSVSYPKCKEHSYYFVTRGLFGLTYFSALSHKRHDFQGEKVIDRKICFDFLHNLPETFLILRRTDRDMIKISFGLHVQYPAFNLVKF